MEMQEVTKEGEKNEEKEGASKGTNEGAGEGAKEPTPEAKTEVETELHHYSKLEGPSENIYSEAHYSGVPAKTKAGKQTEGGSRLNRVGCLSLMMICLILLLVIIILSVKLNTGSTVCPVGEETSHKTLPHTCSFEQCQATYPTFQRQCRQCADGWLTFGQSCFYLSTIRLSWDHSKKNCSERGGSLAVVDTDSVQHFLSKKGRLSYWIGLRKADDTWVWVDNSRLHMSYWSDSSSEQDCGLLRSEAPPERNWIKASCRAHSYFICQLKL